MNCYLALIYARIGEKDLALQLIARLLKAPGAVDSVDYNITINDLKYRWEGPDSERLAFSKIARSERAVSG
jgi:hypothetical protein